jgi:multidrug efflux pump subunit AcrA (membrane-fusion protein)
MNASDRWSRIRLARIAEPRAAAAAAAFVVAALLAAGGCAHRARHEAPETAPVPVAVAEVAASTSGAEIVVPGRVKARREAVLIAYAPGRITDLPFVEGARFPSGAP